MKVEFFVDKFSLNLLPYIAICGEEITAGWFCFFVSIRWGDHREEW